ncbi:DUF4145 domain-containing protein [Devosia sp. BSSL-BM10]|uniref:DUF4145 domain-containing protein n=1 Tax=Devosia litorisediminis TaxID=2829817 RepID=A0A942E9B7_9HYPH|nr:DUF4145 domain-containing protein [Devosia litorisediminis]MBS3850488.1 DUF4145 domain-containing protein [Devosia litorisediminis]
MTELWTGTGVSQTGNQPNSKINDLTRCPHCSVAAPNLEPVWSDSFKHVGTLGWAAFRCGTCKYVVVARIMYTPQKFIIKAMWPEAKVAHDDIPEPARTFLQQAYETLHAPDAAAVMAGSAVDAMLKAHDLTEGSLYSRIDTALKQNILTKAMSDWAHEVRLGSNRPRHADKESPHVSTDEAKQSVEFAEALASFLFVLTARIQRGIEAAEKAG